MTDAEGGAALRPDGVEVVRVCAVAFQEALIDEVGDGVGVAADVFLKREIFDMDHRRFPASSSSF
jgi:hypothetical protein